MPHLPLTPEQIELARNMDAMNDSEPLRDLESALRGVRPIAAARQLFPDRPRCYVSVARDLACYAANKATAIECRKRGDISTAQLYEGIADRIYQHLPTFARW